MMRWETLREELNIGDMLETVISMLADSYTALEHENTRLSGRIMRKDEEVDALYRNTMEALDKWIAANPGQGRAAGRGGGFYLRDHAKMLADMSADRGPKILLGVSYALLDLAEELAARGEKLPAGTTVMETGGMKGRREEISKARMHSILRETFGADEIHSEYGMAELMSQAYSKGEGIFQAPPWMRIAVRDLADPFDIRHEGRGGINIIDLANLDSCAFIQTQDVGRLMADGSFTIDGRVARSDIRGCNLLVQ